MHVAVIVPRTAFDLHPLDDVGPLHWRVRVPHGAFWMDGGRNALMPGDFFRVTYAPAEDFVIDVEPAAGLPCGDTTCVGARGGVAGVSRCRPCAVYDSDAEAAAALEGRVP